MLEIAAHARLGKDPELKQTNNGNEMAVSSVAVDVTQGESDQQTLWLGLVAFGKTAESLMRHKKGDLLSIQGKATQSVWKDRTTGEERSRLSLNVESIISARTARPGGRKKTKPDKAPNETNIHPVNVPIPM